MKNDVWRKDPPPSEKTIIVSIKDDTADRPYYYTSTGWYYKGIRVVDDEVNNQVNGWMDLPELLKD